MFIYITYLLICSLFIYLLFIFIYLFIYLFISVRIIGEPGRYFCSGSSTLAVVVNSKRQKKLVVALPESILHENIDDHLDVIDELVRIAKQRCEKQRCENKMTRCELRC